MWLTIGFVKKKMFDSAKKYHKMSKYLVSICLFQVTNRNTKKTCEICSKFIKIPARHRRTPILKCDINKYAKQLH